MEREDVFQSAQAQLTSLPSRFIGCCKRFSLMSLENGVLAVSSADCMREKPTMRMVSELRAPIAALAAMRSGREWASKLLLLNSRCVAYDVTGNVATDTTLKFEKLSKAE